MNIDIIKEVFANDRVLYSAHAKFEMENDEFGKIFDNEVEEAVYNGEIITDYPDDKPYPSALIFGLTKIKRPIHVVCAYNKGDKMVIIVTVYHPEPKLWKENKRRRK